MLKCFEKLSVSYFPFASPLLSTSPFFTLDAQDEDPAAHGSLFGFRHSSSASGERRNLTICGGVATFSWELASRSDFGALSRGS